MTGAMHAMIRADEYRDAGVLLALARHLESDAAVRRAVAMMATPRNLEALRKMGLAPAHWPLPPKPGDLVVVVQADAESASVEAMRRAEAWLSSRPAAGALVAQGTAMDDAPRTLAQALARQPETHLAVVSVPGPFAAREARRALEQGLSVLLLSDGVTVEAEASLKTLADARGLMVMGPDCGAALLDGVPLGFAGAVRRGDIGVVAASGVGLVELVTLIHRLGGGVSHAVGAGDRDLAEAVGGRTTLAALDRLAGDAATKTLVVLGRDGSRAVALRAVERAAATGRPVVAHLVGAADELPAVAGVTWASSIADAARRACEASGVTAPPWPTPALVRPDYAPPQRWLRGLYVSSTLCAEALARCRNLSPLSSNLAVEGAAHSARFRAAGHHLLDLGDEEYTRGRTHPILDPTLRIDAIYNAANDEAVAVLLLDVVAAPGPAGDPVPALRAALTAVRERSLGRGGEIAVVAAVVGTDDDAVRRDAVVAALEALGVVVMPDHVSAVEAALALLPGEEAE
jgi:FdrA protein